MTETLLRQVLSASDIAASVVSKFRLVVVAAEGHVQQEGERDCARGRGLS